MSENKVAVDRIVDDIVDNFKEITGYDVADVFNKNSDEPMFDQGIIDKSIDSIKNYVSYNYDVDIIANEDILYALDAKLAQQFNQVVDANDNEDPDFVVNESTWAETEVEFGPIAQKKLEAILDANLFGDLGIEIDDNKLTSNIVTGIFTDRYRVAKKEYSNYSEDEIKAARKELFRIINKFYKMATDETKLDSSTEESLTESENDDVRNVIHTAADLTKYQLDMNRQVRRVANSIKSMKAKYPEYYELFDNLVDELISVLKDTDIQESEPNSNIEESYDPPKDMGKMAIEISDYLGEFMNKSDYLDDKYFDEYDREAMGQTFDALVDYARTKNAEGISESATEDVNSNVDDNKDTDKHYSIVYNIVDDYSEDDNCLYSKSEAIDYLKYLLKIEKENTPEAKLGLLTRRREDEDFNFDIDHLSDADLETWFNEFNYRFYDQNKVEAEDEFVD